MTMASWAYAETLTLYGRVNTGLQMTKVQDSPTQMTVAQQYSRFGLKGEEKIGDWNVEFKIENGFDSAGNLSYGLASRQAFIGIKGPWGTLQLGKIGTPTYDLFDSTIFDDGPGSFSVSALDVLGSRIARSIVYRSPEIADVQLTLQVSDANPGNTVKQLVDGSIVYGTHRPFSTAFSFRTAKDSVTHKNDTFYLFLWQYQLRLVTINMMYEYDDFKSPALGAAHTKIDKVFLSGHYNVGNLALLATTGMVNDAKVAGISQPDTGATHFTWGVQYALSKRTRIYGFYTQLNNRENAHYHFIEGTLAGKDNQGLLIGLRHLF